MCFLKKMFSLKNNWKWCFLWIQVCFDKDIEGYGCGIDMIDGALETLDMNLFKRGMFEFSSDVVVDVGRRGIDERNSRKIFEKIQKMKILKNYRCRQRRNRM